MHILQGSASMGFLLLLIPFAFSSVRITSFNPFPPSAVLMLVCPVQGHNFVSEWFYTLACVIGPMQGFPQPGGPGHLFRVSVPLDQLLSLQLEAWSAPQDPLPPCIAVLKVSFSAVTAFGILFWSTSSSDPSPLTCPTRETLPVASYRSSQDHWGTQAPPPTSRSCIP